MKNSFLLLAVALGLICTACKTTEANYRAAYEQAKNGRENNDGVDNTIYDAIRRQATTSTQTVDNRKVDVKRERVKLAEPSQGEKLADYYVLAGQFKQLFNARSLCKRFKEAGYVSATILATSEPLYYIGIPAENLAGAAKLNDTLTDDSPISIKSPYPLVFQPVK